MDRLHARSYLFISKPNADRALTVFKGKRRLDDTREDVIAAFIAQWQQLRCERRLIDETQVRHR
jgi:hypothetical protein